MDLSLPYNLQHLLGEVVSGNETAFEHLYHRYSDTVYGVAFSYTKCTASSEEIVQEVFLKVWVHRNKLAHLESFENYLFILARNVILNHLKRQLRQKAFLQRLYGFFSDVSGTPEDRLLFREASALVHQAMESLPAQQKEVYRMARLQDLRLDEIAERLGLTRHTVRNHLARATASVRSYLRDHGGLTLLLLYCFL